MKPVHFEDRSARVAAAIRPFLVSGLIAGAALSAAMPASARDTAPRETAAAATASGETSGTGLAVVYSDKLHGHKTASGRKYDKNGLTTAHKTLPFGTRVQLTNPRNHRHVTVTVTDRGPFEPDRMFDISGAAARALGLSRMGQANVEWKVVR